MHIRNALPIFWVKNDEINDFSPDLIFVHDVGVSIFNALIYKIFVKPSVLIHIDIHSEFGKDAKRLAGRIYHYFFRWLFYFFNSKINMVFGCSPEGCDFARHIYKVDDEKIMLLPLPAIPKKLDRERCRKEFVEHHKLNENDIFLLHSGKLPGRKRTHELLDAFVDSNRKNVELFICGSLDERLFERINHLKSEGKRVRFLGWQNVEQLNNIMGAVDFLIQPGSLSHSFIESIACGLPLILDDTPQGRYLTRHGNGYLIDGSSTKHVTQFLNGLTLEGHSEMVELSQIASEEYSPTSIAKISLTNAKR